MLTLLHLFEVQENNSLRGLPKGVPVGHTTLFFYVALLQEFLAGTLPNDADSHLRFAALQVAPGAVELEWKAVPGRRYTIEFCGKLASVDWLELTNLPPAETAGTIRVPLDLSGASGIRFLRLGVSLR